MPRASACGTCSRRKVKCDKSLPSCRTCEKMGWKCEGYSGSFRVRQLHWTTLCTNASTKTTVAKHGKGQGCAFRVAPQPCNFMPQATSTRTVPLVSMAEPDLLRAEFLHHLKHLPRSIASSYRASNLFLELLPPHIGTNDALDSAVRCICSVPVVISQNSSLETDSRQQSLYCTALRSLQSRLMPSHVEAKRQQQSEILAAVQLLQMFEQSTNYESMNWIRHAGGSTRLIEALGPAYFVDDLQILILESQLGRITFECIRQGRVSFLNSKEWIATMRKSKSLKLAGTQTNRFDEEHSYHEIVFIFPDLLYRFKSLFHSLHRRSTEQQASSVQDDDLCSLQKSICDFRRRLSQWRSELAQKTRELPDDEKGTGPTPEELSSAHMKRIRAAISFGSTAFLLFSTCMELSLLNRKRFMGSHFVPTAPADFPVNVPELEPERVESLCNDSMSFGESALAASRVLRQITRVGNQLFASALLEVWASIWACVRYEAGCKESFALMVALNDSVSKWKNTG